MAHLLRITIFDVAPYILAAYDKKLHEYATERMVEQGVEVATNCIIQKVDARNLHIKGRGAVPYGILLWAAGNKTVPLVDALEVGKTERGLVRILTDAKLRVKKAGNSGDIYSDVFALGDAADIEGHSLPTTAEVAVQKAKYLVRILNKGPKRSEDYSEVFAYRSRNLVTYIGSRDGIAQGWSVDEPWSGRNAWLSWRSGSFTWTRTWRNWVSILWAWILNAIFGRDVMRL